MLMKKSTSILAGALLALSGGILSVYADDDNFTVIPDGATAFIDAEPASTTVDAEDLNESFGMSRITWFFYDENITVNTASPDAMVIIRGNDVLGSITASQTDKYAYEAPFTVGTTVLEGSFNMYFAGKSPAEADIAEYLKPGVYTVAVPPGFFKYGDEAMGAFSHTYTVTGAGEEPGPGDDEEFTYTLSPAAGATVNNFDAITLTFDGTTSVDYNAYILGRTEGSVARLESEDGSVNIENNVPKSNFENELTFDFSYQDVEWKSGKYTFTIYPGTVMLNDDNWDPGMKAGNFQGLTAEFTLDYVAPEPAPKLLDHLTLQTPTSFDANPVNSKSTFGYGMAVVILGSNTTKIEPNKSGNADWINMIYTSPEGEIDYIAVINPTDDSKILVDSQSLLEDDGSGLLEFAPTCQVYMLFTDIYGEDEYATPVSEFQRTGTYQIQIPDGAFLIDGKEAEGLNLTFNYSDEAPAVDFTYTLTPAAGETVISKEVFENGITIMFPNADFVTYPNKGGGKLVNPQGTEIYGKYADLVNGKDGLPKGLTYKFGNNNTEWINGQYTFSIAKDEIAVDLGRDMNIEEGNFPGLSVLYILNDRTLAVTLVGAEAAESYDVYTLDGKAVALGVAPEALGNLEKGLYIINGNKVLVK